MGDQNYELFCEVGKQFDQHFERLGGTRFLKRCDVDEVEGIEETVHKWYALWPALAAVPAADGADVEMAEAAAPPPHRRADARDGAGRRRGACGGRRLRGGGGKLRRQAGARADRRGALADGERRRRRRGGRRGGGDGRAGGGARGGRPPRPPPRARRERRAGGGSPGTALHHEPGDAISVVCHNDGAEVAALLDALGVADADAPLPPPPTGADVPTHLRGDGLSASRGAEHAGR